MHLASIRKRFVSTTFFIFIVFIAFSQPPIQWQSCFGGSYEEYGEARETSDGGYVVLGQSHSNDGNVSGNNGGADVWVLKLDSYGVPQWQTCLGGTYGEDGSFRLIPFQETSDGGFVFAALTFSINGDVTGNHGGGDIWAVKIDSSGQIEWQRCLGGTSLEKPQSIQQTLDGGCVISSYTASNDGDISGNHGYYDIWVVKLDVNGNIEWQRCVGGSEEEAGGTAYQTEDGGYLVSCTTNSNDGDSSGNHGASDILIVKLDQYGSTEWNRCYGSSGGEGGFVQSYHQPVRRLVMPTLDGGYIFTCGVNAADGDVNVVYNGMPGDMWVVKLSQAGDIVWQRTLGGTSSDSGRMVSQTSDGGFVVSGYTSSNDGNVSGNIDGNEVIWIVKLSEQGDVVWQRPLVGGTLRTLQQAADGGYAINFDAQCAGFGSTDANVFKINQDGGYVGSWWVGNDWQICLDGGYESAATMSFQSTSDGGFLTAVLVSANNVSGFHGGTDIWVTKISPEPVSHTESYSNLSFEVFPNPTFDNLYFSVDGTQVGDHYNLYDLMGKNLYTGTIVSPQTQVALDELPSGIYLLKLEGGNSELIIKE